MWFGTLHTPDWLDLIIALLTALLTWFASTKTARAGAARRTIALVNDSAVDPTDGNLVDVIQHPRGPLARAVKQRSRS